MIGNSMSEEEFIKLSHFDRIRRGYFDKIPLNFLLIGFLIAINVIPNNNITIAIGIGMLLLGMYIKEKVIQKDDIELKQKSKEIEQEFKKRAKIQPKSPGR